MVRMWGTRAINRLGLFWARPLNRRTVYQAGSLIAAGGIITYYWPELTFAGRTLRRAGRTAWTVACISLDYRRHYEQGPDEDAPAPTMDELMALRKRQGLVHERAAERLLRLFEHNGGIYIKVGQHLSTLEYIIPPEYCVKLACLQNRAPQSSWEEVATVIREDLGHSIEELFAEFDPIPIGAASLAQVHRARIRPLSGLSEEGPLVAVKVQHLGLQGYIDSDLFVISCAVRLVKRIFPEFDFDWLADEMRVNLPREVDFHSEGLNAERLYQNLSRAGRIPLETGPVGGSIVRIPKVYWDHSARRVLTMEYLPGVKASDRDYFLQNNIDPGQVAALITRVFSEMIFLHGFVHCDPHPGNLLIRPRPPPNTLFSRLWGGSTQPFELIVLDHGLYRELPDAFRLNYAAVWKAIIDADEPALQEAVRLLLPACPSDVHRLLSCILTQRSWLAISTGTIIAPRSAHESAEILLKAPTYLPRVASLLARLPRPLLLLLKTNDLLRHLERQLGVTRRTFTIMSHYCVDALYEREMERQRQQGWLEVWRLQMARLWAHLRIILFEYYVVFTLPSLRHKTATISS